MFENLTYKQKFVGLGITILILFLAANKRSFKITSNAYSQMKEMQMKLDYVKNNTVNSSELRNESIFLNSMLGSEKIISADEIQQKLLDFTTQFPSLKVDELKEIHFYELNSFDIITNQLILEGKYSDLLTFIYALEKKFNHSVLVSVSFNKVFDYKTRKNKLKVEIILQKYEKKI